MDGEQVSVPAPALIHVPEPVGEPPVGEATATAAPVGDGLPSLIRRASRSAGPIEPPGSGGRTSPGPMASNPIESAPASVSPRVQRMSVGAVDDPQEREADVVAGRVVRSLRSAGSSTEAGDVRGEADDRVRRSAQPDGDTSAGALLDGSAPSTVPAARGAVVRQGRPTGVIRRELGDEDEAPGDAVLGKATTLLEVAQRLVDDLEGHRRGWLIDIKPKKLFVELKKVEKQIVLLLAAQGELERLVNLSATREAYVSALSTMSLYKQFISGTKTGQYKGAKAKKAEIEKSLGVTGHFRKQTKVAKKLNSARGKSEELKSQLGETVEQIVRLRMLSVEIADRAIARGVHIEELAKSRGEVAVFPWSDTLEGQMGWLENWIDEFPEIREEFQKEMTEAAPVLDMAREVASTEKQYVFSSNVYQQLLVDFAALTKPGTSMSQSVKFTFMMGEGVKAGFSVKVSGDVATGDDLKIRPKLAFTVAGLITADLGIWDASASISATYAMAQGFDGLDHFAAHYMRLLSLYDMSFRNFWQLRNSVDGLDSADPEYRSKRNEMIKEAASRGFLAAGDIVEVGDDDQAALAEMQAKPPVEIRAVNITGDVGIAPNDNAVGALKHFGGVTFSASYTRKWFTRLVDYAAFVAANDDVDEEVTRLRGIKSDYEKMLAQLDKVRGLTKMAVVGAVPPMLRTQEAELVQLKNMYEEGHLTFTRRGRSKFLAELNARITELERDRAAEEFAEDVEGVAVQDVRSATQNKKKMLTKTGSVYEVAIGGSAMIGGLAVGLGGKFTSITNDANDDNNGTYLNISLEGSTDITGELIEVDSDAGRDALDAIAESGTFQDATLAPTASAVTATFLTNLGGSVQSVTGVLKGGVKLEVNMVWSNGWFRTQYVRVTRSRSHSLALKAKTGTGGTVGVEYAGGRTDFVAERIGGDTLTYVLTAYQGISKHKDPAGEWTAWKAKNKDVLWKICQQAGLSPTTVRSEVEALPAGKASAMSISSIITPLFASRSMSDSGPLEFSDEPYRQVMVILDKAMKREFEARGALDRSSLTGSGWNSAEGTLDSVITIPVKLGGPTVEGRPKVASKNALTRAVKGSTGAIEDLSRFGTLGNLFDAGATLDFQLTTGADPASVTVRVPYGADIGVSLTKAATSLVKSVDASAISGFGHWSSSRLAASAAREGAERSALIDAAKFDLGQVLGLGVPAGRGS